MKILCICGHGSTDTGACSMGYKEADLTRRLVPLIVEKLKSYATVTIYDTTKNLFSELQNGRESKNIFKEYNYVLEVHFNACINDLDGDGYTTGSECLVKQEKGYGVENAILSNLSKLGFRNRGVKERTNLQNMNMCRSLGVCYCLLETCFIDDKDDLNLYLRRENEVASAVADGIISGFGLKSSPTDYPVFPDVPVTDYGYEDIKFLKEIGVVNGHDDGLFAPDECISRRDCAILLRRLYKALKGY